LSKYGYAGNFYGANTLDECQHEDQRGNLSGIEQTRAIRAQDGSLEHAVGDTGDEVADVLVSGKRGQGLLIGLVGCNPGDNENLALLQSLTEGGFPYFATLATAGFCKAGLASGVSAGAETECAAFGMEVFFREWNVATRLIVRGGRVMICKGGAVDIPPSEAWTGHPGDVRGRGDNPAQAKLERGTPFVAEGQWFRVGHPPTKTHPQT